MTPQGSFQTMPQRASLEEILEAEEVDRERRGDVYPPFDAVPWAIWLSLIILGAVFGLLWAFAPVPK